MSSMTIGPIAGPAADPSERSALLFWMIFTGLSIFAVVLLWRFGLIRLMLTSDRTYISSVIALLYVLTCGHCFLRTRAIVAANKFIRSHFKEGILRGQIYEKKRVR